MESRFESTCHVCGEKIRKGDWITFRERTGKWMHGVCPIVAFWKRPVREAA
jgi:hypothetical protein